MKKVSADKGESSHRQKDPECVLRHHPDKNRFVPVVVVQIVHCL